MKSHKFYYFIPLCLLLAAALGLTVFLHQVGASAADEQEQKLLGTLSARYEAGSPGAISSGNGDPGGKSYGAYQFSSRYDIPRSFFRWCNKSKNSYYRSIGSRLEEAYEKDHNSYSKNFDKTWRTLAEENSSGFLQAQRNFVRLEYYDPIVESVEAEVPGFRMDNYSIALRNVFWSRSVQLGASSALELIEDAFDYLGGFRSQPEALLIDAIYHKSSETRSATSKDKYVMSGPEAAKYGVDGRVLSWFHGSSPEVQLGVYLRLHINEPASAQLMLAQYGYVDAPVDEGIYQLSPAANTKLSLRGDDGDLALQKRGSSEAQSFRLTYFASGCYTIEHVSSGRRLSASSDGEIVLARPSTTNRQLWRLEPSNSGFALRNVRTDTYLSADAVAGSAPVPSRKPLQWQLIRGSAQWSVEGASYPSYANDLRAGSSAFDFQGVLRSTYPIQTVRAAVLNDRGKDAFPPVKATDVDALSYDLSRMNADMAFSRLPAGHYKLVLTATNTAEKERDFRMESEFYVSGEKFRVTFDPQGGTCPERSRLLEEGQRFGELPTAKREGYIFKGWYTARDGGKKVTSSFRKSPGNTTLYARWAKAYTYKFVNYDGKVVSSGKLEKGKPIPAPEKNPTRPSSATHSYTFKGWKGWSEGMTIRENVTFEAQYRSKALPVQMKITSDTYKIDGSWLRKIPLGTSTARLKSHLAPEGHISILKGSTDGGKLAGTGMKAACRVDGKTVHSLTLVVTGDLNGDGKCSLTDMLQLQAHLLGRDKLTGARLRAADVNGNGEVTLTDLVQVTAAILGRSDVKPR